MAIGAKYCFHRLPTWHKNSIIYSAINSLHLITYVQSSMYHVCAINVAIPDIQLVFISLAQNGIYAWGLRSHDGGQIARWQYSFAMEINHPPSISNGGATHAILRFYCGFSYLKCVYAANMHVKWACMCQHASIICAVGQFCWLGMAQGHIAWEH